MTEVTALSTGHMWESFDIVGIFSSRKLATRFCKKYMAKRYISHYNKEEYDKATLRCIYEFNDGKNSVTHIKDTIYTLDTYIIDNPDT